MDIGASLFEWSFIFIVIVFITCLENVINKKITVSVLFFSRTSKKY